MKPWWKKMTIIACCILCAGVVLSGIGWALGGKIVTLGDSLPDHSAAAVQRVFDRLEDFVHLDILDWVDDEVQDSLQQAREEVESAMQRADDAVQKTMNISGTVLPLTLSDEQSQPLSGDITSVRINVGADRMRVGSSATSFSSRKTCAMKSKTDSSPSPMDGKREDTTGPTAANTLPSPCPRTLSCRE